MSCTIFIQTLCARNRALIRVICILYVESHCLCGNWGNTVFAHGIVEIPLKCHITDELMPKMSLLYNIILKPRLFYFQYVRKREFHIQSQSCTYTLCLTVEPNKIIPIVIDSISIQKETYHFIEGIIFTGARQFG